MSADTTFETFARGLVPSKERVDPDTLRKAQNWYKEFVGQHAVMMEDRDLVDMYNTLN